MIHMYDNCPKYKLYPIELFPREYTKDRIHVESRLNAVILTSHDERTHRDVSGIISFDIIRSQIKVRVPVPNVCQIESYATEISQGTDRWSSRNPR